MTSETPKITDFVNDYGMYKHTKITASLGVAGNNSAIGQPSIAGVFGCCGAQALTGCSGDYLSTELMRQEAAFHISSRPTTLYFLPTTAQMTMFRKRRTSILNLLFELGAEEVHVSPNRVHGPNNLHLCVYDPKSKESLEAKKKFLFTIKVKDKYGYVRETIIPLEIAKQCGLVDGTAEVVNPTPVSAGPFRDASGRFARRVY